MRINRNGQHPVVIDPERIAELGVELVVENLITAPELIRHDSKKLAKLLISLSQEKISSP